MKISKQAVRDRLRELNLRMDKDAVAQFIMGWIEADGDTGEVRAANTELWEKARERLCDLYCLGYDARCTADE